MDIIELMTVGTAVTGVAFFFFCGSDGIIHPQYVPSNESVFEKTVKFVGMQEGKCQNWSSDSGNWVNGMGPFSTCLGVTAGTLLAHQQDIAKGINFSLNQDFVRESYDKNPEQFKLISREILKKDYYEKAKCDQFKSPAGEICTAVVFNSGVGVTPDIAAAIAKAGNPKNPVAIAQVISDWHSNYYESIADKYPQFIAGWRKNVAVRNDYISKHKGTF